MNDSLKRHFLRSAGGAGPIRLQVEQQHEEGTGPVLEYHQPSILVGGHQRADLRLEDDEVGQRHLYLQLLDGRLLGIQLSPRVTTRLGTESKESAWMEVGDTFHVGPFAIRYLGGDRNPTAVLMAGADPLAAGSYPRPAVVLELIKANTVQKKGLLDRVVTLVGNGPVCRIRVKSSHASTVDCSLVRTAEGVWVQDLCGREGLRVNGEPVNTALLNDVDILEVANRRLRVRYERSPAEAKRTAALVRRSDIDPESVERIMDPLLDRVADFQAQTYEQFQETMATMARMIGAMLTEHREFVKDEMERFERLARALADQSQERAPVEKSLPAPEVAPRPAASSTDSAKDFGLPPLPTSPDREQIHAWLQQRMNDLGAQRASFWQKLFGGVRTRG